MAELKEQVHSSPELTADEKVLILRCLPQSESPAESTAVHMGQTCGQLIDMKARAIKEREQMTLESVGADRAARGDPLHKALAVTIVGKTMEEDPENPNGFGQVTVRVKCENLTGREIKQFHGLIHCLFPDGYVETVSVQADKPLPAHKASVQTIVLRGSEIDLPYRFARADLSQGTTFWYPWAVVFPDKTSLSRQASDP